MKKVQDHYFKKAKKEGFAARSVYKLEEADKKYHLLKKGHKVLDIGCQPGSWTQYAAKIVGPGGLVVGVDIQKGNKPIQAGGAKIKILCGDIQQEETLKMVNSINDAYDVVLSDMAPSTTGSKWADQQQSLALARNAFDVAQQFLKAGGSFYCKVFEGEDFKHYYDEVRQFFATTKIVKPKSSRKESREVFVLGMGYIKQ